METSTNGAGAAVEAAAAGREDQRGVAGLGFGTGGRAAPEGVPDPELVEQAKHRTFTAEYKARILAKADACTRPGEEGELLRGEGLYTSHLTYSASSARTGALISSRIARSTASSSSRVTNWRSGLASPGRWRPGRLPRGTGFSPDKTALEGVLEDRVQQCQHVPYGLRREPCSSIPPASAST